MASWTKFLGIFVIGAIFAMCIIMAGINISSMNNNNQTILNDPSMTAFNASLGNALGNFQGNVTEQYNATNSETSGTVGTFYFILQSVFNSFTRMFGFIINLAPAFFNMVNNIFGIPPIISGSIFALIVIIGIFLWYKAVKIGEGVN
jgi:hypothetical protein